VTLHGQGLIYRDRRLVNWDPKLLTAISDLEVENKEMKGSLWYLRYPVEGLPGEHIVVATTRPETMLGDTAVAVHPEDARYTHLVGRHVVLPLTGRRIPIVADEYSDPEKGSGAVKITPAHDFNDFNVGKRHNLAMPSVLDAEARVTLAEIELAEAEGISDLDFVRGLEGQDRFAARKAIIARLEEMELVEKIEPHTNQVPHGDRGGVPIEPRLTWQWYADAATLAKPAIEAVETGKTQFVPKQWENTFFSWMRDIQPWCISRQLWWGHQIPAWYAPNGEIFVARTEEEALAQARARLGADVTLQRDPDVLDTWFSSALWPFSTLGWPDKVPEVARYYPGDVLVTGFDIIFFWVARMMMMGCHFMGEVPFHTVYIHGLVRDEKGQKMSKSKGNVIDPLELIDAYGADALRFTICSLAGPGRDIKLGRKRVEDHRSFGTKLWNAARFCELNGISPRADFDPGSATLPLSRWLLDAANKAVAEATAALEAYRFDEYAAACYRFTWGSFCDWFLEFAKPVFMGPDGAEKEEIRGVAQHVLGTILRLLHPAMPYVTEELWDRFGYGAECSLIGESWPVAVAVPGADEARAELDWVVQFITEVRSVRAELGVPVAAKPVVTGAPGPDAVANDAVWAWKARHQDALLRYARLSELTLSDAEATVEGDAAGLVAFSVGGVPFSMDLRGHIDLAAERTRLAKARAVADAEAKKVLAKLANADFVSRAKPEVVEENQERLTTFQAEMARLDAAIARIGG
jgi:valyl-tRNA synthetase